MRISKFQDRGWNSIKSAVSDNEKKALKLENRHKDILTIIKMFAETRFSFIQKETKYTLDVLIDTLNELIEMNLIKEVAGKKYKAI